MSALLKLYVCVLADMNRLREAIWADRASMADKHRGLDENPVKCTHDYILAHISTHVCHYIITHSCLTKCN